MELWHTTIAGANTTGVKGSSSSAGEWKSCYRTHGSAAYISALAIKIPTEDARTKACDSEAAGCYDMCPVTTGERMSGRGPILTDTDFLGRDLRVIKEETKSRFQALIPLPKNTTGRPGPHVCRFQYSCSTPRGQVMRETTI